MLIETIRGRNRTTRVRFRLLARRVAFVLVLFAFLLGSQLIGSRMVMVAGPSMQPAMHTGDVVFVWPQSQYEIGDAVVYRVPKNSPGEGALVVHRLIGFEGEEMILQGDNNDSVDPWNPMAEDVVGKQRLLVPKVGILIAYLRQPAVLAALVAGVIAAVVQGRLADRPALSPGETA
jgi:signal peptidase